MNILVTFSTIKKKNCQKLCLCSHLSNYAFTCTCLSFSVEKQRRELECRYIDDLADLLSDHMGDIASLSVKPDKCHILKSTVDQIQNIKRREQGTIIRRRMYILTEDSLLQMNPNY